MDSRIMEAQKRVSEEKKLFACVVSEVQLQCRHEEVAECDHDSDCGFPPARVCLACGMSEDGWGVGFRCLTSKPVTRVTREDFYRKRVGLYIDEEKKGCSLKDLLVEWLARYS